ncbi:hypothetical protein LCGC14_0413440 [marine sediment metagenome]|uniref:Uncharacterized protein n=1 Tax=marine sediment metagenome TaxID=412755 RepID=A0A0F9TB69_9ZZZZ
MSARRITREFYDKLVEAYRENPSNHSNAATHALCDRRTARRGWEKGWSAGRNPLPWAGPISQLIAEEQTIARARVLDERKRAMEPIVDAELQTSYDREKAASQAIDARKQEAQMIRLVRAGVTNELASVARMLPGIQKWAQVAAEQLSETQPDNPAAAVKLMEGLARITDNLSGAADRCMAMERRLLGEPESIVGLRLPDMSMDDAVRHIEASQRTLARARSMGLLPAAEVVVDAELVDEDDGSDATDGALAADDVNAVA